MSEPKLREASPGLAGGSQKSIEGMHDRDDGEFNGVPKSEKPLYNLETLNQSKPVETNNPR